MNSDQLLDNYGLSMRVFKGAVTLEKVRNTTNNHGRRADLVLHCMLNKLLQERDALRSELDPTGHRFKEQA